MSAKNFKYLRNVDYVYADFLKGIVNSANPRYSGRTRVKIWINSLLTNSRIVKFIYILFTANIQRYRPIKTIFWN